MSSTDATSDSPQSTMRVDAQRAKQLFDNCTQVTQRIASANKSNRNVRLIAVSKLKPANDILALHTSALHVLDFGENYAQELQAKAELLPRAIRWHMIGALQSNKCRPLAEGVPNLWCVSSVDSAKKADGLEKGRAALAAKSDAGATTEALRVQVQINTSGEEAKSGVEPAAAAELCRHIRDQCPHLRLAGVMTIGAIARSRASTAETENEDFEVLRQVRDRVAAELGLPREELELGMGMSSDFEAAVRQGSDEVRVGTGIFGERPSKADAKVKEDVEEGEE